MSIIRRALAVRKGGSFVSSVQIGRHPPPLPTFAISTHVESSKFLSAISPASPYLIAPKVRPATGIRVSPLRSPPPRLVKYGANLRQKFPPGSPLAPLCADLPTCAGLSNEKTDPSSVKPLSRFRELFSNSARASTKVAPELQVNPPSRL